MMKRFATVMLLAACFALPGMTQTETVFVEGFEVNDIAMQGGSVTSSWVDEVALENVPSIEGDWALFVEYDSTSSTSWSQASVNLVTPQDLTGITELRYSVYFLEGTTTDGNGKVPVRSHLPPDDGLSMDYVTPGEWYEIVMPIDPYVAADSMPTFNVFRLVISAGLVGTGRFYLDNIYGVRPVNPPEMEIVTVYGLNETNPGATTPLGWTQDQASISPTLGKDFIAPSEGTNCMLMPVTGGAVRSIKTLNAKNDIDWTRVRAIYLDACVTSDFSTWGTIRPYFESSSGGVTVPEEFRGISGNKADWRTISFWVDLGPHMNSIIGDGNFAFGLRNDNGSEANGTDGQHFLIDNIRVGMVASFCLAIRSFDADAVLYEGDAANLGVEIQATMKGEAGSVTFLETLPEGWTASEISHGGVFADGAITWTVDVSPDAPIALTYTANSPAKIAQLPTWSGSANGETVFGLANPLYFTQSVKNTAVEAPLLTKSVTLDGIIGAGEYEGANVYSFDHDTANGNVAPGVHISGNTYPADKENVSFYVFHDTEYLYVACDVTDPDLSFDYPDASFWNADSTELYFDGNMTRSNSIESDRYGCQLTVVGDGRIAASNNKYFPEMLDAIGGGKYMENGRDGADLPIYWACGAKVKDDESGFVVEYRIVKSAILEPADRTQIGFEMMMNSSEAASSGTRTGKWGWHTTDASGTVVEGYNNESTWTLLTLLGGETSIQEWSLF